MEFGEDTGTSRRNGRLLMSSFSKRKVSRGPRLWGSIWCHHHPFCYLWLVSDLQSQELWLHLPLTHTGQQLSRALSVPQGQMPLWASGVGTQEHGQTASALHLLTLFLFWFDPCFSSHNSTSPHRKKAAR